MSTDKQEPDPTARVSTFGRFHEVARRHAKLRNDVLATIPSEPPNAFDENGEPSIEWHYWGADKHEIERVADEHAIIAIIFAAAACELYINDAAARLLGDKYFEVHVDRIDLVSKWVLVPRLVAGYEMDRGGRAYNVLKVLVMTRNNLMHPKSSPLDLEKWIKEQEKQQRQNVDQVAIAIEAMDRLGEIAALFDPQKRGMGLFDDDEFSRREACRRRDDHATGD